ncbi:MAG: hypothetical protein ACI35R_06455 [Bacillus sp. (in: firmicutes)]
MTKKKLMFKQYCDKCGKEPETEKVGKWTKVELDCSCGGRIKTDYNQPYYE